LGFPYNISATAGASDFKFDMQLSFAKIHLKITRRRKTGHDLGLQELPNIWRFPFNIFTMAKARELKFGTQFGFAKAHHKTTPRKQEGVALGQGSSHIFGVRL